MARKILFFIPSLDIGGAERVFTVLLPRLDRAKIEPLLALTVRRGPLRDALPPDFPVVEMACKSHATAPPAMIRLIRRVRPHAVMATHSHLNLLLGLCKPFLPRGTRLIGRETSLLSHSHQELRFPGLFDALTRRVYPVLDLMVCQSLDMKDEFVRDYGLDPARMRVLPNPVDVDGVARAGREAFPGLPGEPFVTAAGRFALQKRFDLLLKAYALLPRDFPRLALLGDGPLRPSLEALARDLGIAHRVDMPGFAANPHAFMARARAVALSSSYDPFPNTLLEAGACGAPVAAFRCPGGVREIVEEGVTGFTAAPGDPEALAHALLRTVEHPFDREAVRERVRARFDVSAVVPAYERVLLEE
ncbi:N-acetylgalactosamine-N, N'-diacetylbacillosaminyl-diphospho-undecaprenol4-alpha-N-acetylgalactosaminyltransferase [Fundidesulfovibrio magnetotacticus]|uniref:N-acetylgalactosamine-N, N'-diacetylbacillosaminyl-diphospho-undecaprenol 4-alpha-N-acetylgalactosaminyltransferase n=1 Tax=Fundidesulfovibrio magnetotacticus TaxID=2730080 RepID=A0A6V8LUB7_9BACT|nr:glycosyltransferase [Fundidesulfovibrio magnetotacticus]GFK94181.1 N-acetylgalactosamine-N, N'-diacetylbacillosaminyl-diphospho-undecaprenol4-alpha-N-acetylgalactosaminyltransferase [Fundidesulfovibrio magnetotacticus]